MGFGDTFDALKAKIANAFGKKKPETPRLEKTKQEQETLPPSQREISEIQEERERYLITAGVETIKSEEHEKNEDSFCLDERVVVVCDGMGGHEAGEVASSTAKTAAKKFSEKDLPNAIEEAEKRKGRQLTTEEEVKIIEEQLHEFFKNVNTQICALSEIYEGRPPGTTISMIVFTRDGRKGVILQAGDSRIYRLRGKKLERISPEDSYVEIARKYGLLESDQDVTKGVNIDEIEEKMRKIKEDSSLSEEEKQKAQEELGLLLWDLSPIREKYRRKTGRDQSTIPILYFRHQIYNALGNPNSKPHILSFDVEDGDRYLVSSDGIHDNLRDAEIEEILSQNDHPEQIAENLVNKSKEVSKQPNNLRAKPDDMTACVIEISTAKQIEIEKEKFEQARREKENREKLAELQQALQKIDDLGTVRGMLDKATRERNEMGKLRDKNPNDPYLDLQYRFLLQKEALIAQRLRELYEENSEERKPTRPLTPEERRKI